MTNKGLDVARDIDWKNKRGVSRVEGERHTSDGSTQTPCLACKIVLLVFQPLVGHSSTLRLMTDSCFVVDPGRSSGLESNACTQS